MRKNEWLKIIFRLWICTTRFLGITVSETRETETLEGFADDIEFNLVYTDPKGPVDTHMESPSGEFNRSVWHLRLLRIIVARGRG